MRMIRTKLARKTRAGFRLYRDILSEPRTILPGTKQHHQSHIYDVQIRIL